MVLPKPKPANKMKNSLIPFTHVISYSSLKFPEDKAGTE